MEDTATLVALPALTDLNLDGQRFDTAAVKAISKSPMLERLDIANPECLTDDGMRALADLKNLKHIRLSGARLVTDDGLVVLVTGCVQLSSLVIADMEQLTDKSLVAVCHSLPKLECLTMPRGRLSVRALPLLGRLPELAELDFEEQTGLSGGLPTLCAAAPKLTSLIWPREDDMLASEFSALKRLRRLRTISVSTTFTPELFAAPTQRFGRCTRCTQTSTTRAERW